MLEKLAEFNWPLVLLVTILACFGVAMLYSAANGSLSPWSSRHMVRFGFGLVVMTVVALVDIRLWMRWAYPIYFAALAMLVAVEISGRVGMGAQRWVDLGVIQLQPSELAKIGLVLALARYFHGRTLDDARRIVPLAAPLLMMAAPIILVLRQPDLGTAVMLAAGASAVLFLSGVRLWKFAATGIAGLAAIPIAWQFLREYQKGRVLTFLNPERDPLGAGYHIQQSKIALGSGGVFGKGFMQGTQSHLSFLPEKQTDFIFTMLAEELGLIGGLVLLAFYGLVLAYALAISLRCRSQFGRLVGMGMSVTFSLYVFINVAMVMGLIPVVGVPLPLVSYGGTAMLTIMIAIGLLMCVYVHRDIEISRRPERSFD